MKLKRKPIIANARFVAGGICETKTVKPMNTERVMTLNAMLQMDHGEMR
jgi:hypothetical protein